MTQRLFPLAPATVAALLSGCSLVPATELGQEAGLQRNAFFGDATMNNVLVNTGERDPIAALGERFGGEVTDTVVFAFDSAALSPEARATLDGQAAWMSRHPEVGFRVYGHADAPGSNAYNERLGRARAQAVVAYLASRGIGRGRLEALVSYGETQPAVPSAGRELANRRVVTQVSHLVDPRTGRVMDGKYAREVYDSYIASAQPESTVTIGESVGAGQAE